MQRAQLPQRFFSGASGFSSSVVMISESDWESMEETLYLMSSPRNAERLLNAMKRLDAGEGEEHELIDP